MNKKTCSRLSPYIFCILFCSTTALAFSTSPEDSEDYSPAAWSDSDSAKNDAIYAIKHDDLRLLGFAGRGQNLPGVDSVKVQEYADTCGIRFFSEFGDVIREREQLEQMKKAREYAMQYNSVILKSCTLAN